MQHWAGSVFRLSLGEIMHARARQWFYFTLAMLGMWLGAASWTSAQQTLGGITGTVTDPSGSVLPDTQVTAVGDQTGLTRTVKTDGNGAYLFVNLPIGNFTLSFTHEGFNAEKIPAILVQADRTVTLNAQLKVGSVSESVTVEAQPLLNAVDTTNGYILDTQQIQSVPLATGSFTQLAVLAPGVNAELLNSTGSNSGLGNQPIWANGQRDTSNTFLMNGVDATNLFNGKSTSQVASYRVVLNTGTQGPGGGGEITGATSVSGHWPSPAHAGARDHPGTAGQYFHV